MSGRPPDRLSPNDAQRSLGLLLRGVKKGLVKMVRQTVSGRGRGTHTHTLTHSLTHSHRDTHHTHTHTHTLTHSHTHTLTQRHTHTTRIHSQRDTHTHTLTHKLTHTLTTLTHTPHTLTHTLTHTHHTHHTHTHSFEGNTNITRMFALSRKAVMVTEKSGRTACDWEEICQWMKESKQTFEKSHQRTLCVFTASSCDEMIRLLACEDWRSFSVCVVCVWCVCGVCVVCVWCVCCVCGVCVCECVCV